MNHHTRRRTAHTADALRWILSGPAGDLELRITPAVAALLHDGEAEITEGEEIALAWRATSHDDDEVWRHLDRAYQALTAPADPAEDPRFNALRAAARWAEIATDYGTPADARQAEEEHMAALRALIHGQP